ncbi:hypothetical protein BDN72DRAFT_122928 [Pluteus cervinus]|uniref:Uncharacterized protein n=1 Tax=Pluteus cervinus TaxID=181527 RepID=A0ACD3B8A1_9AGAR|nr:hypothetical protein BDN72DRAFT_122928 [Pluteus cervinus]
MLFYGSQVQDKPPTQIQAVRFHLRAMLLADWEKLPRVCDQPPRYLNYAQHAENTAKSQKAGYAEANTRQKQNLPVSPRKALTSFSSWTQMALEFLPQAVQPGSWRFVESLYHTRTPTGPHCLVFRFIRHPEALRPSLGAREIYLQTISFGSLFPHPTGS